MQLNSKYQLLYPNNIVWEDYQKYVPLIPFSDEVVEFLNALSVSLLKDRESRLYPDVITFAFFCRKANLLAQKKIYTCADALRLGRGILFHIAPSNVPINFGYSLVAGMLAGNYNIVRVSSKDFPQVSLIIKHMHKLNEAGEYLSIAKSIVLIRYDRTSDATAFFSSFAAVRVIWGGDATIATIRKNELPPRSFDVCFADRYSIAAIHPKAILAADESEIKRLAENFYNDTYLFDQNACSAPHLIFWLKSAISAEELEAAKSRFWTAIHDLTASKYKLQAILSVDKLTAFYRHAVNVNITRETMPDNFVVRIRMNELPPSPDAFRCAGGYFSEKDIDSLSEIAPIVTNRYQTLAHYGISSEELKAFVINNHLVGLDRLVPMGETTAFSLTWDGYNLIDTFSRVVSIY
ncbi:MAG: acyl-CoA reductase [Tannerellaceae bacterium]